MIKVITVFRLLLILMLLIVYISCGDSLIDSKALLIAYTDKNEYKINEEINYAIVNYNSSPAYVKFCGKYTINLIEKKINGNWEIYFAPVVPAICGPVLRKLEPKEQLKWAIAVISKEGKYRIVIPADIESNVGQHDKIYTNEFIVKE